MCTRQQTSSRRDNTNLAWHHQLSSAVGSRNNATALRSDLPHGSALECVTGIAAYIDLLPGHNCSGVLTQPSMRGHGHGRSAGCLTAAAAMLISGSRARLGKITRLSRLTAQSSTRALSLGRFQIQV